MKATLCLALFVLFTMAMDRTSADDTQCEVCVKVLEKFEATLSDDDRKDKDKLESLLKKFCKTAKGKDERFCFYIGARADSATSTIGDVTKPLAFFMPPSKICTKLNAKDSQICELKYEKQMDFVEADFKKMKVKELKKILSIWGEDCKGCTEKSDFISRVEKLLPQYAPEAAAARKAKQEL
ncbi:mesencephalic astrocyte-derived neurotrophic factor homolog [Watersipora subatra]|uniref:mesencephalic astrocyte-derived neurotrophic factor homolog n=1 Tax=Watersipora subatra TaxID=2589382 RepID=UPI00355C20A5